MKEIKICFIIFIFLFSLNFVSPSSFGYNSQVGVTVEGPKNYTYYINNSYFNITDGGGLGVNLTQMSNSTVITIKESWLENIFTALFNSLFRNWFDQDLNISSSPSFAGINITGDVLSNGTDVFSFEDLNRTGIGSGDNESWNQSFANALYVSNTTAGIQYLINSTGIYTFSYNQTTGAINILNITYGAYWFNQTSGLYLPNWTIITNTTMYAVYGSYWFNQTANLISGDNSSWNESFANTLYSDIQWNYNQTTPAMEYADFVNTTQTSWIESVFLKIVDFLFPKPDKVYLYNDSTTIYFNETKLNETIRVEGLRIGFNLTNGGLSSQEINDSIENYGTQLGFNITNNDTIRDEGIRIGFNTTNNDTIKQQVEDVFGLVGNASYLSTFNATYDAGLGGGNATFNQSVSDTLYIKKANESKLNVNSSSFFGLWSSFNTTQFVNTPPTISLLVSYIDELINAQIAKVSANVTSINNTLYNMNTTTNIRIDNTITNLTDINLSLTGQINAIASNTSFNQSLTDELYAPNTTLGIQQLINGTGVYSTFNKTYDDYKTNVSINYTLQTFNTYDARWTDGNVTFNQSLTNSLYAPNTTAGIQFLINETGVYSTFNATYDAYKTNVSINYTKVVFDTYNSTWDNNFMNLWNYNQTTAAINYLIDTYNITWSSTFNATYDASVSNNTFNQSLTDDLYINKNNESNLNVNSSVWWAGVNSLASILGSAINNDLEWITLADIGDVLGDYVLWTSLVEAVGNWTADKISYSTRAEANANYTSIGNRITGVASNITSVNSTSNWMGVNDTALLGKINAVNSTSNWIGLNDSKLMTINKSNNFQALSVNANVTLRSQTQNFNMTQKNVTDMDCIVFKSGGKICSG